MSNPAPTRSARKRLWAAIALAVVSCYFGRIPLLRGLARFLIVDTPTKDADALVLRGGAEQFDLIASFQRRGFSPHLIVIVPLTDRLERLGFRPTVEAQARRELTKRGVSLERIEVLQLSKRNAWNWTRILSRWMEKHPQARVAILNRCLEGRTARTMLETTLPASEIKRISYCSTKDFRYDETNWWRGREGTLDLFSAYVSYLIAEFRGEDFTEWEEWDPDKYERDLTSMAVKSGQAWSPSGIDLVHGQWI